MGIRPPINQLNNILFTVKFVNAKEAGIRGTEMQWIIEILTELDQL